MRHHMLPRLPKLGSLSAALVSVVLSSTIATAADLDPGYADVPAPIPQQMVSFGSGWYIRGDIGVTDKSGLDATRSSEAVLSRSRELGYDLSLGGGYSFTNNFRVDVVGDFLQPQRKSGRGTDAQGAYRYYVNFDHYAALVNGYYDIGTWSIFTPYIGVGAGMGFGNTRVGVGTTPKEVYQNYYNFAWAGMAGVAVDIYSHTKLDIGYRYLNMGKVGSTTIYDHQARAGIRYMIDN